MNALAAAPVCTGPQAIPCLALLGAISVGAIALGMSSSSDDINNSGKAAGNTLSGTDGLTCTGDCAEECIRLSQQIDAQAMGVQRRLEDLVEDQHDLYNTARGIGDNWGKGSWDGHVNRYEDDRDELKASIALADSKGCYVSEFAREVAKEDPPLKPGY